MEKPLQIKNANEEMISIVFTKLNELFEITKI